ncbi:hypothetical protein SAMN06265222_110112 [Neorhodopirellula lusitana]|uniref:Uncharacterized protein n=1 Tax=Neorhodopirellula lusitana TaxID=445327 RepID=A0ABY1QFY4_9BACT|nr:hypothetical protein [Neorhodopirellula lusitana]SMP67200.1 hypothetical protein SAMN06265222_110112 [Neorhodopirellula lusitana]
MSTESDASSSWLVHQWAVAGIVSAGARFIPIPFVDEMVQGQCRRFVVRQTLSAHKSELTEEDLSLFYSASGGCLSGCAATVVRAPLKLLLFPIRKVVTIFTSVRGVPLEIMRTVLLGRTLDRYLAAGKLEKQNAAGSKGVRQAMQMQSAFENAFAQMDWRTVRAAVKDALGTVDHWKDAAVSSAKQTFDRQDTSSDDIETQPAVRAGAEQVEKVLQRSETLMLFAEFDRRFDEAMNQVG